MEDRRTGTTEDTEDTEMRNGKGMPPDRRDREDLEPINALTEKVIGAAIEVHQALGPGLLESSYEACLAYELVVQGCAVERQVPVPLVYKGVSLDCGYRIDLRVDGILVLELKSVERLEPIHSAQVLTYLRLSGHKVGLLINFNVPVLHSGVRRFLNGSPGGAGA